MNDFLLGYTRWVDARLYHIPNPIGSSRPGLIPSISLSVPNTWTLQCWGCVVPSDQSPGSLARSLGSKKALYDIGSGRGERERERQGDIEREIIVRDSMWFGILWFGIP